MTSRNKTIKEWRTDAEVLTAILTFLENWDNLYGTPNRCCRLLRERNNISPDNPYIPKRGDKLLEILNRIEPKLEERGIRFMEYYEEHQQGWVIEIFKTPSYEIHIKPRVPQIPPSEQMVSMRQGCTECKSFIAGEIERCADRNCIFLPYFMGKKPLCDVAPETNNAKEAEDMDS